MEPRAAASIARRLEPLHALGYFAPEVEEELTTLGLRRGRTCYFASRAAPMGRVGPGTVAATFYVFNPAVVAHLLPAAWEAATPQNVVAARYRGIDAAWRRLLGDDVLASPGMEEAADLARTAARGCAVDGRPLYAAHADLAWPEEPHLVLFHALTLPREHRGDGHVAALQVAGLSGLEALVTHTATGRGFTRPAAQATRGWSEEQWAAAVHGLRGRTLLGADGELTDDGRALRSSIEADTDRLAVAPWRHLGADGAARLRDVAGPLAHQVLRAGAFPAGIFR